MAPPKKLPSNRPMPSTHRRAPQKPGEPALPAPPPAMPSTHRAKPPAQLALVDDGNRYRVRDKDFLKVWGEGLTKAEAEKLKLEVTSTNRSRTARVEPMTNPTPEADPVLASLQASARAASANAAAEANARQAERARRFAPAPEALAAAVAPVDLYVVEDDEQVLTDDERELQALTEDEMGDLMSELGEIPSLEEVAEVDHRASLVAAGVATEADLASMTDKDVAELAAGLP